MDALGNVGEAWAAFFTRVWSDVWPMIKALGPWGLAGMGAFILGLVALQGRRRAP